MYTFKPLRAIICERLIGATWMFEDKSLSILLQGGDEGIGRSLTQGGLS